MTRGQEDNGTSTTGQQPDDLTIFQPYKKYKNIKRQIYEKQVRQKDKKKERQKDTNSRKIKYKKTEIQKDKIVVSGVNLTNKVKSIYKDWGSQTSQASWCRTAVFCLLKDPLKT